MLTAAPGHASGVPFLASLEKAGSFALLSAEQILVKLTSRF